MTKQGRPPKPGELSRYMRNKLAKGDSVETRVRVAPKKKPVAKKVAEVKNRIDLGDPYVKKLRAVYAQHLESGVDGVTSKCHYQGLIGLARSYHAPHEEIKRIMDMHYDSLPQGDKDAIAAYGFEILMGNV